MQVGVDGLLGALVGLAARDSVGRRRHRARRIRRLDAPTIRSCASRSPASPGCRPSSATTSSSRACCARAGRLPRSSRGTTRTSTGIRSRSSSSARPGTTRAAARSSSPGASGSASASTTRAALVRWNSDKRYLGDLADGRAPRRSRRPSSSRATPLPELEGEVVVKPNVSAGGRDTGRFGPSAHERRPRADRGDPGRAAARRWCSPTSRRVDTVGETAVLCIAGEPSHALRKRAVLRPDEVAPVRDDGVGAAEIMYDPGLVTATEATRCASSSMRVRSIAHVERALRLRAAVRPRRHDRRRRRRAGADGARGDRAELLPRPGAGDARRSSSTRSSPAPSGRRRRSRPRPPPPSARRARDRCTRRRRRRAAARARRRRAARAPRRSRPGRRRGPSRRRSPSTTRPASVPAASARIGRPAARYSKSLKLRSWVRVGWAIRSRASAARWSASARSRARLPSSVTCGGARRRRRRGSASSSRQRARRSTSSSRAAASGSLAREPAERLDERPRVAAVAAEAAGVDERDAARGRAARDGRGRRAAAGADLGVPAVRDQQRLGDPARAQVGGGRLGDADDGVGGAEAAALHALVEAALERGRERGRSGSKVQASRTSATHGTPRRCSARPTEWADSGGEVVITQSKRSLAVQRAARARRANGAQASGQRLGHDHLAERVRACRE